MVSLRIKGFSTRVRRDPRLLNGVRVYAIYDGTAIKVGKSDTHPEERLRDLQVGNPRRLQLLAHTGHLDERRAHRLLWRHHLRGEWFATEAVLELVQDWDWLDTKLWTELRALVSNGEEAAASVRV
jgi:hypothetical protein